MLHSQQVVIAAATDGLVLAACDTSQPAQGSEAG